MKEKELLQVPLFSSASAAEIYSGVARMAGVLWCARHRATSGQRADVAVVVVHPSSNFMGHYALDAWSSLGVDAIGMTTRYIGNDSSALIENCVLDVGAVVTYLKHVERYEKVVLVGNSGGGGLAALYQEQAENPSITQSPAGGGPDLTKFDLPQVDALVMLMAHPGRATLLAEWLDPAVRSEHNPFDRDSTIDMFEQSNGPAYQPDWIGQYRAAQRRRNDRISEWAINQLVEVERLSAGRITDMPFLVHGTCADPRFLDLGLDPSDRQAGTLWGDAYAANLQPSTLGHLTSLRSWLSQWSAKYSNGDGVERLRCVTVPVHVIYGTGDQGCFPSHAKALYDAVPGNKELTAIAKGRHYLNDQPELVREMADVMVSWIFDQLR